MSLFGPIHPLLFLQRQLLKVKPTKPELKKYPTLNPYTPPETEIRNTRTASILRQICAVVNICTALHTHEVIAHV